MKNILLIGGSYGIGASLAQILANDNHVTVASRTKPDNALDNVNYITFDASKDEIDLDLLPETIDGFVYFPGSINLRPFKGLSIDSFKQDFDINVLSLIKVLKSILPCWFFTLVNSLRILVDCSCHLRIKYSFLIKLCTLNNL